MFTESTSVGLGVQARSVSAAAIDGVTGEVSQARLDPDLKVGWDWVRRLTGPVAVAYEAGPTGYGLARAVRAAGVRARSWHPRSWRAREAARADLMRARQRPSKLLLRHGIVYSGGKAWTAAHDTWLLAQRFELPGTRAAFEDA